MKTNLRKTHLTSAEAVFDIEDFLRFGSKKYCLKCTNVQTTSDRSDNKTLEASYSAHFLCDCFIYLSSKTHIHTSSILFLTLDRVHKSSNFEDFFTVKNHAAKVKRKLFIHL